MGGTSVKEELKAWLQKQLSPYGEERDATSLDNFIDSGEEKTYQKGEQLTKTGEVENYIYFLKKGAVKVSFPDGNEEWILDFWFEKNFFSSYTSFLTREPSRVYIEALTPVEIIRFPGSWIRNAYKDSITANQFGRQMAEELFIRKTRREMDLLSKSAEERYRDLVSNAPEVIEKIPVNQVARYLGIHPESLSRIRKSISF